MFLSFLLAGCAGQKAAVLKPEPLPVVRASLPPREEPRSPFDRVMQIVSGDSGNLAKYFVPDEESYIVVKADIRLEDGEDFEVSYDLARAFPLENGQFRVGFTAEEKRTGERRYGYFPWTPKEDATGVLLSFDDDYEEIWGKNFDLLDRYGAKVTFFVLGEPGPFCAEALGRGHDVGYHSAHHLNLPKVSRDIFFQETLNGIEAFRTVGIPLKTFAYPYGLWDPWMLEALAPSFTIQRGYGVTYRLYDSIAIQGGYISSKAIDNILYQDDGEFDRLLSLMLRAVKFIGGDRVLPLTTHTISDTADWGIKPRRLEYVLQTIRDLGLKFYRYRDFLG
ncbi:MAG: polysaccharide deacetylase family protein [Treponema sp.]|nr:polysaccharide deacetylase family protein [Treponema sp.]